MKLEEKIYCIKTKISFQVSGRSELSRVWVIEVKFQYTYEGNPREIDFVSS